jgi:hypothetical protein
MLCINLFSKNESDFKTTYFTSNKKEKEREGKRVGCLIETKIQYTHSLLLANQQLKLTHTHRTNQSPIT